jgi:hypothetical protein
MMKKKAHFVSPHMKKKYQISPRGLSLLMMKDVPFLTTVGLQSKLADIIVIM